MSWNAKFIFLIVASTLIDYIASLMMSKRNAKHRRKWLYVSLMSNLGLLFLFKYFNFFNVSLDRLANLIGWNYPDIALNLILPVGISFYTFQTMSYTIDVYKKKIKPEKHLGIFALYVSYFPQLVAGPIERSSRLLPQLKKKIKPDLERIRSGLILIVWGLFKKVVIADRAAVIANEIFNNSHSYDGLTLVIGVIAFSFQIFGDFSGYSDIAIGSARLLGHDLMKNFDRPYFSKSISEFWSRWHISLSTWFRDYLYIPLGGNRVVKWRWYYNLMITFVVSGLWHGAALTFIFWGLLHGSYLVFGIITEQHRLRAKEWLGVKVGSPLDKLWRVTMTYILVCVGWIFFRAASIRDAFYIIVHITDGLVKDLGNLVSLDKLARFARSSKEEITILLIAIAVMELVHLGQRNGDILEKIPRLPTWLRWNIYTLSILLVITMGVFGHNEFIYFQF